jgi:holo-[acyl-carrier protein] synthase
MTKSPDLVPAILAMCESTVEHGAAIRVGLDVVSIAWFAQQLGGGEDTAFVRTAFTPAERIYCAGRPERFAVRWAAKEAVAKAIGTGFRGLRPGDIEILHHPDGRADVTAGADSTWPHEAHAWAWALTLCHEGDAALAVAIGSALDTTLPQGNVRHAPLVTESQSGHAS